MVLKLVFNFEIKRETEKEKRDQMVLLLYITQ